MARQRVFFCSVDGMRPDAIEAAHTPTMDRLMKEGAYTLAARTVMPSVTLPCHTSMLRGVEPSRHGINTNTFHPLVRHVPSLIEVAKDHGKRTGFFYNWEELRDLAMPGKLDVSVMLFDCETPEGDPKTAQMAINSLKEMDFDLLFLYLGTTDSMGHAHGWMSEPYLKAVSNADACIGRVLSAIEEAGQAEETTTLILSDHGGHGRSHGTEMDEDMLIPWLLYGRGVKKGHVIQEPVRIYDTCVTLAHLLGCDLSSIWDGKVVQDALL